MLLRRIFAGLLILLSLENASAQMEGTGTADSLANSFYQLNRGSSLAIYNGRIFQGYGGFKGNGYYAFTDWRPGAVLFDGVRYDNMKVIYDIYTDDVILRSPNNDPIILYRERVQRFSILTLSFVLLGADKGGIIRPGFYQEIAVGPLTIYAKRMKVVDEKIEDGLAIKEFRSVNRYYALKDGVYHQFNKQKKLLALIKDKRSVIQQELRKQGLKFKTDPDRTMAEIARIYNQSSR